MKRFFYLAAYGLMLTSVLVFTGCSDDDDEGGGAPKADNSYITDANGNKLLLTQVGNDYFSYNVEGLLTGFGNSYEEGTVTYNPMKVIVNDGYESTEYNIGLNGSGFISSISWSWSDDDETGSAKMNLSYDGSGRLTKVTGAASGTETDEGETYKTSENLSATFTYSDGKLTKVSSTLTAYDDGDKYTDYEDYVYEYASDAPANTLGQFSQSLLQSWLLDEDCEWAWFAGFLGNPSSYFPTSVKETYNSSDEGHSPEVYTTKASYSFNSNGTLSSEKFGSTYRYSYSNAPAASTRAAKNILFQNAGKSSKKHGFFHRHRNK